MVDDDAVGGRTVMLATGIVVVGGWYFSMRGACAMRVRYSSFLHRPIVEIVWLASVGVGLKV